jgi:hypothetical protein
MLIPEYKLKSIVDKIITYLSPGWEEQSINYQFEIEKEIRSNLFRILDEELGEKNANT